jgi:hypothetical protein
MPGYSRAERYAGVIATNARLATERDSAEKTEPIPNRNRDGDQAAELEPVPEWRITQNGDGRSVIGLSRLSTGPTIGAKKGVPESRVGKDHQSLTFAQSLQSLETENAATGTAHAVDTTVTRIWRDNYDGQSADGG